MQRRRQQIVGLVLAVVAALGLFVVGVHGHDAGCDEAAPQVPCHLCTVLQGSAPAVVATPAPPSFQVAQAAVMPSTAPGATSVPEVPPGRGPPALG